MSRSRAASLALLASLALASVASAQIDQVSALREGNRLFREGRIDEAYDAYLRGYDPSSPHPILSYNLGTAAQHLGKLPEAILWYRRAADLNPGDPWMRENLDLARAALGLQPYPAPGLSGLLGRHANTLYYLAALLAWIGAGLWIAGAGRSARAAAALLAAALILYAGTLAAGRYGPAAAVVLEDCSSTLGDLPAGSEVWIMRRATEMFEVAAGRLTLPCPPGTVSAVSE